MKAICVALTLVTGWFNAEAQISRDPPPLHVPPNSQTRNAPPAPGTNIIGLSEEDRLRMNALSNLASNLPPYALTNLSHALTNLFGLTNAFVFSNRLFAITNGVRGSNRFANFGIATLSALPPEQVRAVRQVQTSLNLLEQASAKLRNTPDFDQAIDQSPYLQQQLGAIVAELNGLNQGTVRPSEDTVERFSRNLVRALMSTELSEDQQFAVSVAINQIANSGNVTQAEFDESISTVQAALRSAGAPSAVVEPVIRDPLAFAIEVQPRIAQ